MRPIGEARRHLLQLLHQGHCGTFDVLARHSGLPESQVRCTLANMRRAGLVQVLGVQAPRNIFPCCIRAVYAAARFDAPSEPTPLDALALMRQVWR